MQIQIVGVQHLDFTNDDGDRVIGTNLHVNLPDPSVDGLKARKIFIAKDFPMPPDIKPNEVVDIDFNDRGKVVRIRKISGSTH